MPNSIGILTYHNAINYGALLQAYALSTRLNAMGADCRLIDYRSPAVERQYRLRAPWHCSSLRNFVAHNLNCLCRLRRRRGFAAFAARLPRSAHYRREQLPAASAAYDRLITGSDQVFNPSCNADDPTYFLDFAKQGQKVAYAASVGSCQSFAAWGEEPLQRLADFSAISLREADAAAYLSGALSRECLHAVDPVWLLSPAEWAAVAEPPRRKEPYILVYNLMDYPYMRDYVRSLSAKTGLPVISINRWFVGDRLYRFTERRSNVSPAAFLGYIRGAACVVTDSFHGTSFSMLFGRPFYAALNTKAENTNGRLLSLLNTAGIAERAFSADCLPPTEIKEIDYAAVHANMREPIERSLDFLKVNCL